MKLSRKNMILISFMLFSLFFGAGNLIFPPLLGQQSGANAAPAVIGFLITAVILPVLGIIVVGKFGGLTVLAGKVSGIFSLIFTILIYVSIGPGLGIPRAGSVPFEMAIAPYLSEGANTTLWMLLYTFLFFAIVFWLCMNPGKLVKRIGTFLTPALLLLIVVMFVTFLFKFPKEIAEPTTLYQALPFLQGFVDGYQTMDTIAALNFGLVIALTLHSFGIQEEKGVWKHTLIAGICAGLILTFVYVMLAVMGVSTSGVYEPGANGAVILRSIMFDLFGGFGAFLLAAIFTLACLTTCVGLTNSISVFFSKLMPKVSYNLWVLIITAVSFLICNLGLNAILAISVPILNAVYPVAIVLILLGLFDRFLTGNRYVYPFCIYSTFAISVVYALDNVFKFGKLSLLLNYIPLYKEGFAWVLVCLVMLLVSLILPLLGKKSAKQ